ncbi:MAG: cph1 [Bacteroidetes bacterium]|jgi:signal transduction histidine kinase|nr:cph1 [Bacteroidota bacterium]
MASLDNNMTNISSRPSKILAGAFVLMISLLITLSIISMIQTKKQIAISEWVQKSFGRILKIEENVSLLRDLQARHRAFLLSKDSSFRKEYDELRIQVKKSNVELESLFSENPTQLQLVQEINELVNRRLENMNATTGLSRTHSIEELSPLLMIGYADMDRLQAKVKLLEKIEEQRLKEQIDEKDKGDKKIQLWILLFSVSSLVIVLMSFLSIRKEIYKRTMAEIDSEVLDKTVNERTSEILNVNLKLKQKNIDLKRMNSELNAFNFITNHDMQEPLRKIETFIAYIKEKEPDGISSEVKPYFERIVLSANRMRELINSISIYSTYSRSQEFVQGDLNKVARNAIEKTEKLIKQKNAKFEISNLPVIAINSEQIEALFIHLINNSLKFSKEFNPPLIKISAKKTPHDNVDSVWRIDFSDNGIGFNEKYNDRIFNLFERLHDSEKYSGTGIGLPICKKIVENHNGSISASSAPGHGTTISVFLPEHQPTIRED